MRKISKHGRKLRQMGVENSAQEKEIAAIVGATYLTRKLAMHQPYDHPANIPDADKIMADVRLSLHKLANGLAKPGQLFEFGSLADHIGTGQMRTLEIEGDIEMANHTMEILNAAGQALYRAYERHERVGKWGLDGPGILDLTAGVDAAETLMRASTPAQMKMAQNRYIKWRETTDGHVKRRRT